MTVGVARRERLFPLWLGGPLVSEVAYRIFLLAFPYGLPADVARVSVTAAEHMSNVELVARVAELLDYDEADVLRGLAELERVGVFGKGTK